ncbi:hypothetical protein CCMA1212_006847 [Trichoderma ghanense]|uniref:Uncharacterized protein n=1 Tax=Trichoderma ghanense TaxID=65468 RepID=A0ABY2H0T3_9HYPO
MWAMERERPRLSAVFDVSGPSERTLKSLNMALAMRALEDREKGCRWLSRGLLSRGRDGKISPA